jgi:hypothetical protein
LVGGGTGTIVRASAALWPCLTRRRFVAAAKAPGWLRLAERLWHARVRSASGESMHALYILYCLLTILG